MLMYWATIEAYTDADSLLDIDYCRALYAGCHVSQMSAYEWLYFIDMSGLDDPGDMYDHLQYPEVNGDA